MAREERIILTDILETLKEILKVQKLLLKDNLSSKTSLAYYFVTNSNVTK